MIKSVRQFFIYSIGVPVLNALDRWIAHYSLVGNDAVLDPDPFAWATEIEDDWETFRDEFLQLVADKYEFPSIEDLAEDLTHMTRDAKWKTYFLNVYGEDLPGSERCPKTMAALHNIPDMKNALFSILMPGKHIPKHRGEYKGFLRCHLGLIIPKDRTKCRMNILDETVCWEKGQLVIFDNAYHHEVWNETDEKRVILMFDVIRPMRAPWNYVNKAIIWFLGFSPYVRAGKKNQKEWETKKRS